MDENTDVINTFGRDETITVTLADDGHTYFVSKALLCDSSDYFKKALCGSFAEAKSRKLSVPGCDAKTFQLFLFYLVKNKLPDIPTYNKTSQDNGTWDGGVTLGRLWIFGDFLIFPELQNRAMDQLLRILVYPISCDLLELAYGHSAEDSPLRRVVLAEAVGDHHFSIGGPNDRKDMDRIGALPGFFYDFRARLAAVDWNVNLLQPSATEDHDEYMVME